MVYFSFSKQLLENFYCSNCSGKVGLFYNKYYFLKCRNCDYCFALHKLVFSGKEILVPDLRKAVGKKFKGKKIKIVKPYNGHVTKFKDFPIAATFVYGIINEVLNELGYKKNIIDMGSGDNRFLSFTNKEKDIVSFDIRLYDKYYYPVNFFASAEKVPLGNNLFDVALSNFVLQHVDNQENYLGEAYRLLRKGGFMIVSVPSPAWYVAYFISPTSYSKYFNCISLDFVGFIKNPVKHFLHNNSHGNKKNAFTREFYLFSDNYYTSLFDKIGFKKVKLVKSCNVFSLYKRYAFISKIFSNGSPLIPIHYTYVLRK